jgi:3-oxoacyl-(acyl-carrier-protein) synthase
MGAAGVMEAVSVIKSITRGIIPATLYTAGDIAGINFNLITENCKTPIKHAISESFGFGGACAALLLSKYEG